MRYLKITLAYDGTEYAGWQVQPRERTVQLALEQALVKITGESVRAVASGRTDAGVHALGQVVSVETRSTLPAEVLQRALHANTPRDIAILDVADAPEAFHAIRDAIRKRYRYVIQNGPVADVFLLRYAWHVAQPLDVDAMQRAALWIKGRHDFAAFQAAGSQRATSVRTISDLTVQRQRHTAGDRIVIEVEADGFLYNMVRNIVGSLVEVGRGSRPPEWLGEVLESKVRQQAGPTAPPHGLVLVQVDYADDKQPTTRDKPPCESHTSLHE